MVFIKNKVSIVITCYNYGRFLAQAIESALSQSYPWVEVIVVDDGSTDNTQEIIREYKTRIRYIYQENVGVSRTRNRGLSESNGTYVNFLDADDWLLSDKIEIQMRRFEQDPNLDVVACGRYDVDEEGNIIATHAPAWGSDALDHLLNNVCFTPNSALVKRSALERVGGFCEEKISESWTEDTDLWIRLAGTGSRFFVEPLPLCTWRHHNTTVSRSENIEPSYIGFNKMIVRLEKMKLPLIESARWNRFRFLVRLAFSARFYEKGQKERATQIYTELGQQFSDLYTPFAQLEFYRRTMPTDSILDAEDVENFLIDRILPEICNDMDTFQQHQIYAAAWLAVSDLAYASKNTSLRHKGMQMALLNSVKVCFSHQNLKSTLRGILGPNVIGCAKGRL